ncbi:unnamed protein product [Linum trigynum]|uniref:Uncharacterized protein n=1 Tax=Linum trigynum TaxID=586398 RepID=A0AAV2CP91_9ROSI
MRRAESAGSHIKTAASGWIVAASSGCALAYSALTRAAASSATSALTRAMQQPLNPAPLNLAPYTPGVFTRISYSCISGSQPSPKEAVNK